MLEFKENSLAFIFEGDDTNSSCDEHLEKR